MVFDSAAALSTYPLSHRRRRGGSARPLGRHPSSAAMTSQGLYVDWMPTSSKRRRIDLRRKAGLRGLRRGERRSASFHPARPGDQPPFITADRNGPKHINMTVTRAKIRPAHSSLVGAMCRAVKDALAPRSSPKRRSTRCSRGGFDTDSRGAGLVRSSPRQGSRTCR